jgi:hypothetical protein
MRLITWFILGAVGLLATGPAGAASLPSGAGVWTVLAQSGPSGKECGVATHLANGADLRLVVADGEIRLIVHHPGWMLPAGQADVAVIMGQDAYIGSASVVDRSTLVVEDLSGDFLRHFIAAPVMTTDFGGIRWKVDLRTSDSAAWALARCASAAGLADAT